MLSLETAFKRIAISGEFLYDHKFVPNWTQNVCVVHIRFDVFKSCFTHIEP